MNRKGTFMNSNSFSRLAQETLSQTRQMPIVKDIESRLPFELKEENFRIIAKNVVDRAKLIRERLVENPFDAVKDYRTLLDLHSLAPVKKAAKKKAARKTAAKKTTKKAAKKSTTTTKARKTTKKAKRTKKAN